MQNQAIARLAIALVPLHDTVDVWVGPGNNGGDGWVAARLLHKAGRDVAVHVVGDVDRLPPDALRARAAALNAGVRPGATPTADGRVRTGLVIDALLGLGARRAPDGPMEAAIRAINRTQRPVLSVDLPSGLHPDTGDLLGHVAVRASATLALLTLKPGCFTAHGRDHAGTVWLDTLGATAPGPTAHLIGPARLKPRAHATHKGSYGDAAVVGGASGMTGAAWLAARAALAAGAGRVFCSLLDPDAPLLDPVFPELMGRRAWWRTPASKLAATTVACGCGSGDAVGEILPPLLAAVPRLVLDADALNAIASTATLQRLLRLRADRGQATLLTPHPLEAARLLRCRTADIQADRLIAAQALADRYQAGVLLKGSGSIIAAPSAAPRINPTGNAALATAGTGDVLAGWACGSWAREPDRDAADIASDAAWAHGLAADGWSASAEESPLRASSLIEWMIKTTSRRTKDNDPGGRN